MPTKYARITADHAKMRADYARMDANRKSDLALLESGNFADVDIVCGNSVWKCHSAILAGRSEWFRKALSGAFQEASERRVKLNDEKPASVALALKSIYGAELNVRLSVSIDHFMEDGVDLWHLADFLLLVPLRESVERAIREYCEMRSNQLVTPSTAEWSQDDGHGPKLSPWALDLIIGLRDAYKWDSKVLKTILMEFLWDEREWTMGSGIASTVLDHLKDTPTFIHDFLTDYGALSGP